MKIIVFVPNGQPVVFAFFGAKSGYDKHEIEIPDTDNKIAISSNENDINGIRSYWVDRAIIQISNIKRKVKKWLWVVKCFQNPPFISPLKCSEQKIKELYINADWYHKIDETEVETEVEREVGI